VAIAGVMGSEHSEVDESTTDVLLEAANFEPIGILKTSERLGLRSEASARWEKGIDPYLAGQAAKLATQLFVELTEARWVGHADVNDGLPQPPVVPLRPERADHIIGLEVPPEEQASILVSLGFEQQKDGYVVPTWRMRDVTREVDLIEEIARMKLDEVPYTLPIRREMFGRLSHAQRVRRLMEEVLVGVGFFEAYTPSLVDADPDDAALRIPEPQSLEQAVLRTTVLPGLIEAARYNLSVGNTGIALFEIARVYLPSGKKLPEEYWRVGGIVEGGYASAKGAVEAIYEALKLEARFERAEGNLFHPGKTAKVDAGIVGELLPTVLEGRWGAFELDLATLAERVPERTEYEDVITYPAVRQDLAFTVPEDVAAGELIDAAREAAGAELRRVQVFDVYHGEQVGEGRKSIAFSVEFQSPERTLSDEDAATLRKKIVGALEKKFGAELRA
jgi:phenylalanyl-tRNA synthetase beta chain